MGDLFHLPQEAERIIPSHEYKLLNLEQEMTSQEIKQLKEESNFAKVLMIQAKRLQGR